MRGEEVGTVMLAFRIPGVLRKRVKAFCAEREMGMGAFLVEALTNEMRRREKREGKGERA